MKIPIALIMKPVWWVNAFSRAVSALCLNTINAGVRCLVVDIVGPWKILAVTVFLLLSIRLASTRLVIPPPPLLASLLEYRKAIHT